MKKRIVLLLSVGLMAAWLWGCGGQEAEEPQEPAAEETTEEEEAEPVEEETEEAEEETAQEAAPAGDIKPVETTIDSRQSWAIGWKPRDIPQRTASITRCTTGSRTL